MLQQIAGTLGLVPLEYDEDHRTRVFGQVLDHILVRGLEPVHTSTLEIRSSDHNPMTAVLRLKNRSGVQRGR